MNNAKAVSLLDLQLDFVKIKLKLFLLFCVFKVGYFLFDSVAQTQEL